MDGRPLHKGVGYLRLLVRCLVVAREAWRGVWRFGQDGILRTINDLESLLATYPGNICCIEEITTRRAGHSPSRVRETGYLQ